MKKNSLTSNKGLSLSQAQSVSNLCNQRAKEIDNQLNTVNNYSKSVIIDGVSFTTVKGTKLPENIVDLLTEKAALHACQAFLMENIKAKDAMLQQAKKGTADISSVVLPKRPDYVVAETLPMVDENFGWEQLTLSEVNEFIEAEANASHIGMIIHNDGLLDSLRKELPNIPAIEWMVVNEGKKSPIQITVHHTSEELLKTHEELAALHRAYECRVNYFKAKIKNLTTMENARIAKLNADNENEASKINDGLRTAHEMAIKKASEQVQSIRNEFEKARHASIKEISAMRISVDPRFQQTVNMFLEKIDEKSDVGDTSK